MPISSRVDARRRLVVTRAHGRVTEAEVFREMAALHADSEFEPQHAHLVDLCGVTGADLSSNAIVRLVRDTRFAADTRVGLIAPTDLVFGLARMYELFAPRSAPEIAVFRETGEALEWLGLPADYLGAED